MFDRASRRKTHGPAMDGRREGGKWSRRDGLTWLGNELGTDIVGHLGRRASRSYASFCIVLPMYLELDPQASPV